MIKGMAQSSLKGVQQLFGGSSAPVSTDRGTNKPDMLGQDSLRTVNERIAAETEKMAQTMKKTISSKAAIKATNGKEISAGVPLKRYERVTGSNSAYSQQVDKLREAKTVVLGRHDPERKQTPEQQKRNLDATLNFLFRYLNETQAQSGDPSFRIRIAGKISEEARQQINGWSSDFPGQFTVIDDTPNSATRSIRRLAKAS
jgi:hypothetical protein